MGDDNSKAKMPPCKNGIPGAVEIKPGSPPGAGKEKEPD
jgi:hypothetical protein